MAYCFAITAAASTGQDVEKLGINGGSGSIDPQNLIFAAVCFTIALAAMMTAIRIRHHMGRPIFAP